MIIERPTQNPTESGRKYSIGKGIGSVLAGLFIYRWVNNHSPYNPFGAIMVNGMDAYIIKEPIYTVILLLAAGLALFGISRIIMAIVNQTKAHSYTPQKTESTTTILDKKFCTECGKQNREQAQFCGYCGRRF